MTVRKAKAIKVVIVDDHALYRAGLRDLLEGDQVRVVAEAGTGSEAVKQVQRTQPDVVVMDLHLPGMDGLEASGHIREQAPRTEIVMISGQAEKTDPVRALRAGAKAFVDKGESAEAIVEAVRAASRGELYLPTASLQVVVQQVAAEQDAAQARAGRPDLREVALTNRQKDVLRLLAAGNKNAQIAEQLNISVRSVGNHLAAIYAKLRLHSRAEAIRYALKEGLDDTLSAPT